MLNTKKAFVLLFVTVTLVWSDTNQSLKQLSDNDPDVRISAIVKLAKVKNIEQHVRNKLHELLHDPNFRVRKQIIQTLHSIGTQNSILHLITAYLKKNNQSFSKNEVSDLRKSIHKAIEKIGVTKNIVNDLTKCLGELKRNEPGGIALVVGLLEKVGTKETVPHLISKISNNWFVNFSVEQALKKIGLDEKHGDNLIVVLNSLRKDETNGIKFVAELLGKIKAKQAIPHLIKRINNEFILLSSLNNAFDSIGVKEISVSDLIEALKSLKDDEIYAIRFIAELAGKIGPDAQVIVPHLAKRATSHFVRAAIREAFKNIYVNTEDIIELLNFPEQNYVFYLAVNLLKTRNIKSKIIITKLINKIGDDQSINLSIEEIIKKIGLDQSHVKQLIEVLNTRSNKNSTLLIVDLLKSIGPAAKIAVPHLVAKMGDELSLNFSIKEAIEKIGLNQSHVVQLMQILKAQSDKSSVKLTMELLAEIGPAAKPTIPHLIERIGDDSFLNLSIQKTIQAIGLDESHVAQLVEVLTKQKSKYGLELTAELLAEIGPAAKPAISYLIERIGDDSSLNSSIRKTIQAIGLDESHVMQLVKVLTKQKSKYSLEVTAELLAEIGPAAKPAIPHLIERIGDDSSLNSSIQKTIQAIGLDESHVAQLVEVLTKQKSKYSLEVTAELLAEIGPAAKPAIPHLLERIGDDLYLNSFVKKTVEKVGLDKSHVAQLIKILATRSSENGKRFTMKLLARVGPAAKVAIPHLLEQIGDDLYLNSFIEKTIEKIGLNKSHVAQLVKILPTQNSEQGTRLIVKLLKEIGSPAQSAIPSLIAKMSLDNSSLHSTIEETILNIGVNKTHIVNIVKILDQSPQKYNVKTFMKIIERLNTSAGDTVPYLIETISHKNRDSKKVKNLILKIGIDKSYLPDLMSSFRKLEKIENDYHYLFIVELLGEVGPPAKKAVSPILKRAARDIIVLDEVKIAIEKIGVDASHLPVLTEWINSNHYDFACELIVKLGADAKKTIPHILNKMMTRYYLYSSVKQDIRKVGALIRKIGVDESHIDDLVQVLKTCQKGGSYKDKLRNKYASQLTIELLGTLGKKAQKFIPHILESIASQNIPYHTDIVKSLNAIGVTVEHRKNIIHMFGKPKSCVLYALSLLSNPNIDKSLAQELFPHIFKVFVDSNAAEVYKHAEKCLLTIMSEEQVPFLLINLREQNNFYILNFVIYMLRNLEVKNVNLTDELIKILRKSSLYRVRYFAAKAIFFIDKTALDKIENWESLIGLHKNTKANALMWAVYEGEIEFVKALIVSGSDVLHTDKDDDIVLTYIHNKISQSKKVALIKILCPVILRKAQSWDLRFYVAKRLCYVDVTFLQTIEGWPNLIGTTEEGNTALMVAAKDDVPFVKALIESGANIETKNQHGKTALDFAKEAKKQEIIELLQKQSK
ncbi:HEAT repeat domain-containing protein [Candidatus Uabimicrobium sp. HlEnr_7]|uniref:HEAT repeat domain-containing protein n=1 Tax=Candidatus Uabimicrobium helgolandensis TaxID=3095367 RepID=UPI0035570A14